MKAAVIDQFGNADSLHMVTNQPMPQCANNQVLIRVEAAGINPLDYRIRKGELKFFLGSQFPMVLGNDIAGTVINVGEKVTSFNPGDRVFALMDANSKPSIKGFAKPGGYAEYAVTRDDTLARIPEPITATEAAAVPLAALTAYQVLIRKAPVDKNSRVLINGASGGVGSFAVQIAKLLGAQVSAVASSRNGAFVKGLGADEVISYQEIALENLAGPYDVIYDVIANSSYSKVKHLLSNAGIYVSNVPSAGVLLQQSVGWLSTLHGRHKRATYAWVKPIGKDLQIIAEWMATGELKAFVEKTYSLDQVQQAHQDSEAGHVRGKIVLNLDANNP